MCHPMAMDCCKLLVSLCSFVCNTTRRVTNLITCRSVLTSLVSANVFQMSTIPIDSIETSIRLALDGKPIDIGDKQAFCDFSIKDQIKYITRRGIIAEDAKLSTSFVPVISKTVCYIVGAVVINDQDELLMIQEAKEKHFGTWFLPAGKLEPGEQLVDGVKREVLEETGMTFEPESLVMVQVKLGIWYRFAFAGRITGGQLKTVPDGESLQAKWIPLADLEQLELRSRCILPLIDSGKAYYNRLKEQEGQVNRMILPQDVVHKQMLLRLLVVAVSKRNNNHLQVLVSERDSPHLPTCEINPEMNLDFSLNDFLQATIGVYRHVDLPEQEPRGVLSVEHSAQVHKDDSYWQNEITYDGLCLTVLVSCIVSVEGAIPIAGYNWVMLDKELEKSIKEKLKNVRVPIERR